MNAPFQRLTVIGLGLIGGSLAMAARAVYPELWIQGVDPQEEVLAYALKNRIVDRVSLTLPQVWEPDHLIIIATHLSTGLAVLKDLAPLVSSDPSILVSDVGSCKRPIADLGASLLPQQFIGGHPMAGKEFSGIEAATSLLFSGKAYLLCPSAASPEVLLQQLEAFVQGFGATPRRLDSATHDRYMAYVSHLPQLYSILLTNLLYQHEPARLLSYHGGGIDDQLRLAASPYAMWGDIFNYNSDNLRHVLQELTSLMGQADQALDHSTMASWFERSNQLHQIFQSLKQQQT